MSDVVAVVIGLLVLLALSLGVACYLDFEKAEKPRTASKPIMVCLNDCPIGDVIHEPHTWRGDGIFLTKYGCDGVSKEFRYMLDIMKAGSEGTLTKEMSDAWLESRRNPPPTPKF